MTDIRKHILHEESINPADTSPRTEAEAAHDFKVTSCLAAMANALRNTRQSVRMQDICDMHFAHTEFEAELPEIDGIRHGVFLYSVSGTLNGQKVRRVLLDGHCIQVSAKNRAEAERLSQQGLQDTINEAHAFAFMEAQGIDPTEHNAGISTDAGGQRVQ